ncbi:MAG TPA: ATPase domain-containing protein [Trebonia sp.]|nr:ATPase domain-containing protein [Trebonia sp.]
MCRFFREQDGTAIVVVSAVEAMDAAIEAGADAFDEWVHDLLHAVEGAQASRVVIDSLMDLQMAAADDTRFREFMYSLAQRFSRQGISLLITYETPDLFSTGRLSQFAVSHLADNAIALNYHRDHSAMSRSLAIFKTRASNHDPAMRQFSIGPDSISLQDTAIPGASVNHGPGANHWG